MSAPTSSAESQGTSTSKRSVREGHFLWLSENLLQMRKDGFGVDLHFTVRSEGENQELKRIPAHKIVAFAASDVFKRKLDTLWDSESKNEIHLELHDGGDLGIKAGEAFVEALYDGDISEDLNLDDLLKVTSLAHMFQIDILLNTCWDLLSAKVTINNCVEVLAKIGVSLDTFKPVGEKAEMLLKMNVVQLIEDSRRWDSSIWDIVLEIEKEETNSASIPAEEALFRALRRWRQYDEDREGEYRRLLRKVRFPLMNLEHLVQEVDSAGALSSEEYRDVTAYIIGGGLKGYRVPSFECRPRIYTLVKDSASLKHCLSQANSGQYIRLAEGEFKGPLTIKEGVKLTIRGSGKEKTRIICDSDSEEFTSLFEDVQFVARHFKFEFRDSTISNLSIIGNNVAKSNSGKIELCGPRNRLEDVDLWNSGLILHGCNFTINNISINSDEIYSNVYGIDGHFSYSTFSNIAIKNAVVGIFFSYSSKFNSLESVKLENVTRGMCIEQGDFNTISNVLYKAAINGDKCSPAAVEIVGAANTTLTNLDCDWGVCEKGYSLIVNNYIDYNDYNDYNSEYDSNPPIIADKNFFKNIRNGIVRIEGKENILQDVEATSITLSGTNNTQLTNCRAPTLILEGCNDGLKQENCNFPTTGNEGPTANNLPIEELNTSIFGIEKPVLTTITRIID